MAGRAPGLSKRQKTALTVLGVAACAISYAAVILSGWLRLLIFPIAYATVLVRTW